MGSTGFRVAVGTAVLVVAMLALWQPGGDGAWLERWIGQNRVLGAVLYFGFVTASVVVLPFSSLPLLPVATRSYGVVATALLSAGGWWVGSLIAFEIARKGRRVVERFASLGAVDRIEQKMPRDLTFGAIVVLRMVLPVDLVSFALGLMRRLAFKVYATASLIGILPFAFVWSYAGGKLGAGQYLSFALIVLAVAGIVFIARRRWKRGAG